MVCPGKASSLKGEPDEKEEENQAFLELSW